jgi:hypothetical protein
MDTTDEFEAALDRLDTQREILTQSLNEVASDIGMALRDVGLNFPLFITVRQEGDALATIATPHDPSDEDWQAAVAIVCRIISGKTECGKLRGRQLACVMVPGSITAADVASG